MTNISTGLLFGVQVNFIIEDAGAGISDLDTAFTIAGKSSEKTVLNEHGFGFKNALSCANPDNDSWSVVTRTAADAKLNRYKRIDAPYEIGNGNLCGRYCPGWIGQLGNTGTIFMFSCNYSLFCSEIKGMKRVKNNTFDSVVAVLVEDLGFTYAKAIQDGELQIQVITAPNAGATPQTVKAVLPKWDTDYAIEEDQTTIDLGGGNVSISYEYGRISTSNENFKHYTGNMESSGAEIAVNGRVIESNVFKEIWSTEKHPSQNHFILRLNLVSQNPDALPKTRSTKNGFCKGDPKLDALFSWIRKMVPEPVKAVSLAHSERELFDALAEAKRIHLRGPKVVEREFTTFERFGEKVKIDLYVSENGLTTIYEGKRINTTPKDVYQLKMYWDGCVVDGITPNEAILIASNHPQSVLDIVALTNTMFDATGTLYRFVVKTWHDEGVNYPAAP